MSVRNEQDLELYFIALIPHEKLRDEIRAVKERMRDLYGAGHALRSPAHITLQKPFKRDRNAWRAISAALRLFAQNEQPFTVELDGYGAFAPRVIYLRLKEKRQIATLHARLKTLLLSSLDFAPDEIMKDVEPHITVATRDLTREAFSEAWPVISGEPFTGSFVVRSIFLLRHNGRYWDILEEFPFRGDE